MLFRCEALRGFILGYFNSILEIYKKKVIVNLQELGGNKSRSSAGANGSSVCKIRGLTAIMHRFLYLRDQIKGKTMLQVAQLCWCLFFAIDNLRRRVKFYLFFNQYYKNRIENKICNVLLRGF